MDPYAPSPCPLPPELEGECGCLYTGRTRNVPGERDSELSDVLKQLDDVYLGDQRQSNPKSKI